ncbi:MAG: VWA domain-containing protein [Spirochaetales bacterium]|nr:VWA domain-containing protein [Spirochaetales bacterium]
MKKTIMRLIIVAAGMFIASLLHADDGNLAVHIDQIIDRNFPVLEVFVSVTTKDQEPILQLVEGNFSAFIDGKEMKSKINIEQFVYAKNMGVSFYLLIDNGGVMYGEPMDFQKQAAKMLLEDIEEHPQDTISLYTYTDEAVQIFENETYSDKLFDSIDEIENTFSPPKLYDSVANVVRKINPEVAKKRKIIIITSNGRDDGSQYTQEQVFEMIDKLNIPVYTIGFRVMGNENLNLLESLSNHTGGAYIFARRQSLIPNNMKTIIEQVRNGYILKFSVNEITGADDYHQLKIAVTHKEGDASFYKNFFAKKTPFPYTLVIIVILLVVIIAVALAVIGILFFTQRYRIEIGTIARCKQCKRRIKKEWVEECPFCKYLDSSKKKEPA